MDVLNLKTKKPEVGSSFSSLLMNPNFFGSALFFSKYTLSVCGFYRNTMEGVSLNGVLSRYSSNVLFGMFWTSVELH